MLSSLLSTLGAIAHDPWLASFLVATLVIGLLSGRNVSTVRDYAVANRAMSTGVLTIALIATVTEAFEYIQFMDILYTGGIQICILASAWVLNALVCGGFIAPKMVYFSDCYTLPAVVGKLLGNVLVRIFVAIATILAGLAAIAGQFEAIADLLSSPLGIPKESMILSLGLFMTLYTFWGGVNATSTTDVLKFWLMVMGMSYAAFCLLSEAGGIDTILAQSPPHWSWHRVSIPGHILIRIGYLTFFPTILIYPGIMQRMLIACDKRQGRYMFFSFAFFTLVFNLLLFSLIALSVHKLTNTPDPTKLSGGSVIGYLLGHTSTSLMRHLLIIGVLSAIMSSIDSYTSALGLTFIYDIIIPLANLFHFTSTSPRDKGLYAIRVTTLLIGIGCTTLAWYGFTLSTLRDVFIYLCAMVTVGCLLPILGLKSSQREFWASTFTYALMFAGKWYLSGSLNSLRKNNFDVLIALTSLLAWLAVHIATHGGIMVVKRSQRKVSEQLWLPSRSETFAKLKRWWEGVRGFTDLAYLHTRRYGYEPYLVGFFLAMECMVPQLGLRVGGHDGGWSTLLIVVRSVSVFLLLGLWLEALWPVSKRVLFPAYYYVTIGYCLPFVGTLFCMCEAGTSLSLVRWCLMLLMLSYLTNWGMMMHLLSVGVVAAMVCFRYLHGAWLPSMGAEEAFAVGYLVVAAIIILFAFGRFKEQSIVGHLFITKILGSGIAHETRNFLGVIGAGEEVDRSLDASPATKITTKKGTPPLYQIGETAYEDLQLLLEHLRKEGPGISGKVELFNNALINERFDSKMGVYSTKQLIEKALQDFFMCKKGVAYRLKPVLTDDFKVCCSAPFFKHLIYNLIRNAWQHGGAEEITITLHADTHTLSIEDNGKGIPPEILPFIFDLFYTSKKDLHTLNTGLGLALVKGMLDAWGAKIVVHSKQGERSYTCFEITFPALSTEE